MAESKPTRPQSLLPPRLQEIAREQADLMFPECDAPVPMVLALPRGIHPYNRASGYFDPVANTIVLYQEEGGTACATPRRRWS